MVRFAPEINIKSPKVKARFVKQLIANIKDAFKRQDIAITITQEWNRLFVDMDHPSGLSLLSRVFGICHISPVEASCSLDVAAMEEVLRGTYAAKAAGKKICLRVRRAKEFLKVPSKSLEVQLGGVLATYASGVDLTRPDLLVHMDLWQEGALFYSEKIKGPGGLPLGSQGRALCLISGGFDSAVAAYMMMKRGVALDFCLFNLGGKAYEMAVLEVVKGLCDMWAHGVSPKLRVLDFTPITEAIKEDVRPKYAQVVLKRAFYKCASRLAKMAKDCPCLITGEAIGQVSSQTLHNLVAIEEASQVPVLRPLIAFDKEAIISLSRQIGSYSLCENIKEFCGINQKKPVTKCRVEEAKAAEEAALTEDVYEKVFADVTSYKVRDDIENHRQEETFIDHIPDGAIVIDTRTKQQYAAWHFPGAKRLSLEAIALMQYEFDKDKVYVFYCPVGVETALLAENLQKRGVKAYSFKGGSACLVKYCQEESLDW